MIRVPVDGKRADWPRLVADAVNRLMSTVAGLQPASRTVSTDHAIGAEQVLLVDATTGPVDVTLPAVSDRMIIVKKVDASANAVTVSGAATIDGAASVSLTTQYETLMLTGGNEWHVI